MRSDGPTDVDAVARECDKLIEEYGDDCYKKAVEISTTAVRFDDHKFARLFADVAIELMQRGYHKKGSSSEQKSGERTEKEAAAEVQD